MNDLEVYQQPGLPDAIEDLAHFLLIAPEKATAMRAEIRAIQKVGLAKAVYDQKLEEQRRLCDMILDASVRLGEMTRAIPKASAGRPPEIGDSAVPNSWERQKTKAETIQDLGFSKKQVQRFETLADNKDLVEQEKALAREEGRNSSRRREEFTQARNTRKKEPSRSGTALCGEYGVDVCILPRKERGGNGCPGIRQQAL